MTPLDPVGSVVNPWAVALMAAGAVVLLVSLQGLVRSWIVRRWPT